MGFTVYSPQQAPHPQASPQASTVPTATPVSSGNSFLQGAGNVLHGVGNFLFPATTSALTSVINSPDHLAALQKLQQPNQQPLSMPNQVLGGALSVLPGGVGARNIYTANTPAGDVSRELGGQILMNEGMNTLGDFLKPVLQPIKDTLTSGIPSFLTKLGINESGAAGQKAFTQAATGTGKELSTEVVDRGLVNNAAGFTKQAMQQIDAKVPGSVESGVRSAIDKIPVVPLPQPIAGAATNVEKFLVDALDQAGKNVAQDGGITKGSQLPAIQKELGDIYNLQIKKIGQDGWQGILDLRRSADGLAKGRDAADITSVTRKVNAELANVIRTKLSSDPEILQAAPELPGLIKDEHFWSRLLDAMQSAGSKAGASKSDIVRLLLGAGGGGAIGTATGVGPIVGAMAGIGAANAPFTPLGASLMGNLTKRAGEAATTDVIPKLGTRVLLNQLLQTPTQSQTPQVTPMPGQSTGGFRILPPQ